MSQIFIYKSIGNIASLRKKKKKGKLDSRTEEIRILNI